ncbi:hypothetical protein XFF6992_370054 [Xanthomonas citri pv. fuscans]|nr:hypothetical protein XFF6992_370054 [Xanthomonas citri pv. fuscans]SOO33753.1 hypothetical protein XFF6994_3140017 [Xanthomonas citri pv. fuscans]
MTTLSSWRGTQSSGHGFACASPRDTRFGTHMSTLRRTLTQPAVIAMPGPQRGRRKIGLVAGNWSVTGHVTTMPGGHPISLHAPLQVNGGKDRVHYQSAIEHFRK